MSFSDLNPRALCCKVTKKKFPRSVTTFATALSIDMFALFYRSFHRLELQGHQQDFETKTKAVRYVK